MKQLNERREDIQLIDGVIDETSIAAQKLLRPMKNAKLEQSGKARYKMYQSLVKDYADLIKRLKALKEVEKKAAKRKDSKDIDIERPSHDNKRTY